MTLASLATINNTKYVVIYEQGKILNPTLLVQMHEWERMVKTINEEKKGE